MQTNNNILGTILRVVIAAIACCSTATVSAAVVDEIITTAEKREANLQETSLAVGVLQGQDLRDLQIEDIQGVVLNTPSLSFSRAGGEGQIYIRGVGANLLGIGQDSSVAIHQDGVYLGRSNFAINQFLDVERVEVLRGPQGTLYGRNATAGVINIISKKPTEETEGYASAYIGEFDRLELETAVGGPISDTVGYRVAARWTDDDGYTDDLDPTGGDTVDDQSFWGVRGILDFQPSDELRAEVIAEYGEADGSNRSVQRRDNRHTSTTLGALPNPDFDQTRNDIDSFQDWEIMGLTLTVDWDINSNLSLTSITSYRDFEDDFSFNTDGTEIFVTETQYQREADQLTQELRLSNTSDGPVEWLLGIFYMNEDKVENLGLPSINFFGGGSFNIFATNDATAWAAFGQASWQISDRVKLIGGLRYSDEEKDDCSNFAFGGGDLTGLNNPMTVANPCDGRNTSDSWDDWTPKVGVDFQANDNMLLYASVTTGFKSGGTNSLSTSAPPFNQEDLLSYEVGIKSDWMDDRLRFNGSAFYYDYDDLQVLTFAMGTTRIDNAASAEVLGLEAEISAVLSEDLLLNFGFTWLDTEYDDFVTTFGQLPAMGGAPNIVDISGNELINAPEFKLVTNLRYDFELPGGAAYVFGQVMHQAEVFHSQFNEPEVGQDDYTIVDARFGYMFGPEQNWEFAVIVNNAFDEEYYQNSVRFTSLSDTTTDPERIGAALGYPGPGRSFGAQLRYSF